MKKIQLQFSDTQTLSDFILLHEPSNAEVNSISCSLTGDMEDQQIAIACSVFNARVKKHSPVSFRVTVYIPPPFIAEFRDCQPLL